MKPTSAPKLGPKSLFNVLKGKAAVASNSVPTRGHFQKAEFGSEFTLTVVDDIELSVPGTMVGRGKDESFSFTLKPESVVDNRPETEDVLFYELGNSTYRLTESAATSEPASYSLVRLGGAETESLEFQILQ